MSVYFKIINDQYNKTLREYNNVMENMPLMCYDFSQKLSDVIIPFAPNVFLCQMMYDNNVKAISDSMTNECNYKLILSLTNLFKILSEAENIDTILSACNDFLSQYDDIFTKDDIPIFSILNGKCVFFMFMCQMYTDYIQYLQTKASSSFTEDDYTVLTAFLKSVESINLRKKMESVQTAPLYNDAKKKVDDLYNLMTTVCDKEKKTIHPTRIHLQNFFYNSPFFAIRLIHTKQNKLMPLINSVLEVNQVATEQLRLSSTNQPISNSNMTATTSVASTVDNTVPFQSFMKPADTTSTFSTNTVTTVPFQSFMKPADTATPFSTNTVTPTTTVPFQSFMKPADTSTSSTYTASFSNTFKPTTQTTSQPATQPASFFAAQPASFSTTQPASFSTTTQPASFSTAQFSTAQPTSSTKIKYGGNDSYFG